MFCVRSDYQLAKQKLGRKEEILNVNIDWSFTFKCIFKIICQIYRTWKKEIAAMEAQEDILMLENRQMASELIVKQGIIDLQPAELLQVHTEFAEQANKVKESVEKFRKVLDSLNLNVLF
jgi:hypothetical protein